MRTVFLKLVLSLVTLGACAPSVTDLQKTLEQHPEILVGAIEKNPEKIIGAIQKAAQTAERSAQEEAQHAEKQQIERELKHPLQPKLTDERLFLGPKNAPITIVEYTDFQCPYCARGYQTMEEVRKLYGDKVRLVIKHLPLPIHPMARPAAARFEAIGLQDKQKAWKYYHEVFTHQDKLNEGQEKYLDSVAKSIGVNVLKMKKDMNSEKVLNTIKSDMSEAEGFEIRGTPGFIVEGVSVRGAYPISTFKMIIDNKLAEKSKK